MTPDPALDCSGPLQHADCTGVPSQLLLSEWTPRELRHSFVSLLSDAGVPIEKIDRLVGHSGTATTEFIYRKQIRPVVTGGAEVMDSLFPRRDDERPRLRLDCHGLLPGWGYVDLNHGPLPYQGSALTG